MSQAGIRPETRALAERLVALEADSRSVAAADQTATCRVCEKLRRPLVTLTGTAGFSSLLARALTLAKRESPPLHLVQVRTDGSIEGLEGDAAHAHVVLVAYLLSLLITFVGDALTTRLLLDICPDLSGPDRNSTGKDSQ